jgi:hypothetical protein
MNTNSVHQQPRKREYDEFWLSKWHLTGSLSRCLGEIDRDRTWRNGTRTPHTQAEHHQAHAVRILMQELKRLDAVKEEE